MTRSDSTLKKLRILLVEDSFDALNLIKNMMQDAGITQIYTARDGKEALDFLGAFDGEDMIDVVLCDWNMPRMTGLELLRQIRTCDPHLPFLMITGAADTDSVTKAKYAGVTGYIEKPFSAEQLRKKLEVMVRIVAHRERESA